MRVRLSPQARSDLDAIWLYVARETGNEDSATRLIESTTSKFALLSRFPFIGRALGPDRGQVRTFLAFPYLIFYRPMANELRILRVIHSSRDAFAVFGE